MVKLDGPGVGYTLHPKLAVQGITHMHRKPAGKSGGRVDRHKEDSSKIYM
jgi:hypothetical protein